MQVKDLTAELMRMLELKLLEHLPSGEFNKDNITANVMNNLLENMFHKSMSDLNNSGATSVMMPKQILKTCLTNMGQSFSSESAAIQLAFTGYLKQNQSEELYDEAAKMSEYLIDALPVLIEEYVSKADFS